MEQTKLQINMCDFVYGRCEAVQQPKEFLANWFKSNMNPCSVCHNDKSKCSYYKELIDSGIIEDKENTP